MDRIWIVVFVVVTVSLCGGVDGAEHEFRYKAPDANNVDLMADFNGWKAVPMKKGPDGVWTAKVSLSSGTHAYKFLVNGKDWMFDPDNPTRAKADGIENSAVEVGGESSAATASPPIGAQTPALNGQRPAIDRSRESSTVGAGKTSVSVTAKAELSPTPGEVLTIEVPLSAQRRAEVLKDKDGNANLAHARLGIAVPQGFDPQKTWPILVVSNTEAYSNIDSLRQFKDAALNENWVILAADEVEAEKDKEGSMKWPCLGAALDYLTNAWPGIKNWPVACGGMSGGAKNSSFLAADLARENHRVIGLLLMGCNQDMATVAYRKGGAPGLLSASVFISSGKSDTIATPARAAAVKSSLQSTGFRKVRLENYDGAHDIYQPHVGEALRWFLAPSAGSSAAPGSSPSSFDKFFKKKS